MLAIKWFEKARRLKPEVWDLAVNKFYQFIRVKESFVLKTKEVSVKKGKRRYTLLVIETVDGNVKFNLGRI